MIPLTDEEKEYYENEKICHTCEKEFCTDKNKEFKKMQKVKKSEIIVIIQENKEEQLIIIVI